MAGTTVAFRVDSGTAIGSGHVMRCLNVANVLRGRGASVAFVMREHPGHLIDRVEAAGHEVRRLAEPADRDGVSGEYGAWLGMSEARDAAETLHALRGIPPGWVVVDHYGIGTAWEGPVHRGGWNVAAIDDLANRDHDCAVLIDQNYHGIGAAERYRGRLPQEALQLLGPRYAMMSPEFAEARRTRVARAGRLERVFVYFGATDGEGQTLQALEALCAPGCAALEVDVVIGPNNRDAEALDALAARRGRTTLHRNLPSLAALMARADLGLGAGGVSMWERCCVALPSLVATIADNQVPATRAMANDGRVVWVGPALPTAEDWRRSISDCMADRGRLASLERRTMEVTDGLGAMRVARALLGTAESAVSVRRATAADERLLLEWSNDPVVRAMGFHPGQITEEHHARWFSAKLADRNATLFIGMLDGELPAGQVRFDADRAALEAIVSISVDPALRGGGLGDRLLEAAITAYRDQHPDLAIIAEVREDNVRSQRLFSRRRFQPCAPRRPGSVAFALSPAGSRRVQEET